MCEETQKQRGWRRICSLHMEAQSILRVNLTFTFILPWGWTVLYLPGKMGTSRWGRLGWALPTVFWEWAGLWGAQDPPLQGSPTVTRRTEFWGLYQSSNLLTFSPKHIPLFFLFFLRYNSHPIVYEVIYHRGSELYLPNDSWCGASFHMHTDNLFIFFREMSIQVLSHFSIGLFDTTVV